MSWVVTSWDGAKRPSLNKLAAPWPVWRAIQWWLLAHVLQARSLQSLGGGGGGLSFTASWDAGISEGETIFAISCWGSTFLFCMGHPTNVVADSVSITSCLILYVINA